MPPGSIRFSWDRDGQDLRLLAKNMIAAAARRDQMGRRQSFS
jgi:hypothetical protein